MSASAPDWRLRAGRALLGTDRDASLRWLAVAAGVSITVYAVYGLGLHRILYYVLPDGVVVFGATTLFVGLAAWQAYVNRGLLICAVICVGPVLALFLQLGAGLGIDDVAARLAFGIRWALLFGVPMGVLGFLLGSAFRWSDSWFERATGEGQ